MRIERSSVFGKKSFPGEHDHLDRCFQTFEDRILNFAFAKQEEIDKLPSQ